MENQNISGKKKAGGIILDILTIGLLFASFAALFYSGFIIQSDSFPLGALCAITAVGLLLLFLIGAVSCLSSKVKNDSLTAGFLAFSAVQLVALIVNLALLLGIMVKLFSVSGLPARITYIVTTAIVLIGYVASIFYFSDGTVGEISEEDKEDDQDDENEEADDEDDEADETADETDETADEADKADDEAEEVEEIGEVGEVGEVGDAEETGEAEEIEEPDEAESTEKTESM